MEDPTHPVVHRHRLLALATLLTLYSGGEEGRKAMRARYPWLRCCTGAAAT